MAAELFTVDELYTFLGAGERDVTAADLAAAAKHAMSTSDLTVAAKQCRRRWLTLRIDKGNYTQLQLDTGDQP